jgi:DNA (cytosine-5)-methyltransferase 1
MRLAIDLCCGTGGWTSGLTKEGFEVIGFDVIAHPGYSGQRVLADVRTLDGRRFREASLIVASPPCEEFSRHSQPWTRRRVPPPPDLSIAEACYRLAREAGVPLVLENVRGAQSWLGPAVWRWGACYLWGDGVPILRQWTKPGNGKERLSSKERMKRARVPEELARFIGSFYAHG